MALYTSTLPPGIPEEQQFCQCSHAKPTSPHNTGAYPSLGFRDQTHSSIVSNSNSTDRTSDSSEFGVLTFFLSPMVPEPHEHIFPVHYRSMCFISQRELESRILADGYVRDSDEMITVEIVDPATKESHSFLEWRSVLSDSGLLNKFFESEHFQPHAETTLVFSRYEEVVIETQFCYLYYGKPAVHALRAQLMQFCISVRINCLIEIIALAKHMEIQDLVIDAFALLSDISRLVTPRHCIMLVELFYGINAVRDGLLQSWANQCIADNLHALNEIPYFVHLSQTSWLKFQVDRLLVHEVCPFEDKEPEPEEPVEQLEPWVRGAPPGSQLGPTPPPRKKAVEPEKAKKWWRKGGKWVKVEEVAGGVPAAGGEGKGGKKGKGKVAGFFGRH